MSVLQSSGGRKKDKRVLSGTCPDPKCQARLFFPAHGSPSIECTECGQRHEQRNLRSVEEVTDPDVVLHNLLRNALLGVTGAPKKGTELVKVMGLSNYHCKLLSPVLTRYGMDKQSGKAKLLREMNQGEMFDCSLLGDRAFLIEPDHVSTVGYGKDRSGSLVYLHDTLEEIKKANGNRECLIPVHVDGDGHCLVHAVSRALVGRELFWHALRENLKQNFKRNLDRYKALFQDFIDAAEWEDIINECDPLFVPPEGVPLGLRNIHIFGLANVLHRPIILLDSLSGMRSSGDYSATFLPGLVHEDGCKGKDGKFNKPICIAWSSSGRNHYIPLVGIKHTVLPALPAQLLPKAWGVPQELIRRYIRLEPDGSCVIGGDRSLQDKYLMRLVGAMEEVFMEKHGIHPSLVADVHQYVYRRTGVIGAQPEEVTEAARRSVQENRLHRCLICGALSELHVPPEWLAPGGKLYNLAKSTHGQLRADKNYSFPLNSVVCSYDVARDVLLPDYKLSQLATCHWCHGTSVRHVHGDGSVAYLDGDRTNTRSSQGGKCGCGFKHYWEAREYDNLPEAFPITLEWGGQAVRETVYWFQHETDASLNSNVYDVAIKLVTKHFPGEFGSELLVQKVVNTILRHTAKRNPDEYNPVSIDGAHGAHGAHSAHSLTDDTTDAAETAEAQQQQGSSDSQPPPTKIILTGQKSKTLHKEELTMSRAERSLQHSISEQAPLGQRRLTDRLKQNSTTQDENKNRPASPGGGKGSPETTTTTPTSSSSPAPATPTKHSSPSSNQEKKIRVSTSDGRQATLTLSQRVTFSELQRAVWAQLAVPPQRQCIRHGFPPRELLAPPPGQENEPLAALQHGDRVTVEILRGGAAEEKDLPSKHQQEKTQAPPTAEAPPLRTTGSALLKGEGEGLGGRELQDSIDLEISSLCLLATLMGEDVWSYAKKMPHLFQQGGVFFNIVKKDMGLLDGKHCSLPHLLGKTFVYNGSEQRVELCVDAVGHFPVGPHVDELVKEALAADPASSGRSREGSPAHGGGGGVLRLGSGGVVRKKEQSITAFQGKGHSLGSGGGGSSPQEQQHHRPITRQHSSGVDLSGSVSRGAELWQIPEEAGGLGGGASHHRGEQLVRVAPGVSSAAASRVPLSLDPGFVEEQRRRLLENVSNIQASMERALRQQQEQAGGPPALRQQQQQQQAGGPPAAVARQPRTDGAADRVAADRVAAEATPPPPPISQSVPPPPPAAAAAVSSSMDVSTASLPPSSQAQQGGASVAAAKEDEEEMESQDNDNEEPRSILVSLAAAEPMDHS